MADLLRDFATYLKAIFAESQRLVFTAFDIVGIILFFFPHLAQGLVDDVTIARGVGGLIVFMSFLLANFTLYRKAVSNIQIPNGDSFLLYPYEHPPYNNIEMRYIGPEPIKDLEVWLTYRDKNNEVKRKQIEQFFPQNDPQMIWHQFKANVLEAGEIVRFHLIQNSSTADGKVMVEMSCVGAKSGTTVSIKREFDLKL
jgi:hypothetical protein